MPAGGELCHQPWAARRNGLAKLGAARLSAALMGLGLISGTTPAAQAGLLGPLLNLMRPQLEVRITSACQQWASGGDRNLEARMAPPCRALAGPTSRCLIEETERSGRSFGVMTELLAGRFGDDSEVVVKRCAGRLLGLPADSFMEVPIRDLARRFKDAAAPALNP
ncbi:hypothetical protein KUL97_03135 [Synechococcus sp. HK05]|uniref:hypothetical protein n=1 Tax=Synechococcus sp. HK05 TaxID=2725975 RepID=UPI001C386BC5|nr:hypothetical protein [Synechococcus sp. HK05]MBV2350699.1 hypothetical protein [Synechococcus sp. HK05]